MSINPTLQNSAFLGNQDFTWWLGTVENDDDKDAKLGRVRVKILGFHKSDETPENLPWAIVMQPTTNAATSGVGNGPQLKAGSFVMGFFLDYPDCQQPVVMGTFYGKIQADIKPKTQSSRDYVGAVNIATNKKSEAGEPAAATSTIPTSSNSGAGISVDDSVAAKSLPASLSNPSGILGATSIANGKDGPAETLVEDIKRCVESLGNIFKTGKVYQPNKTNPTLSEAITPEQKNIPVTNVEAFPPKGKIQIGNEIIGYNGKNEYSLVLTIRGMNSTKPLAYPKGTKVKYIPKTTTPIEIVGKFTDKVVDLEGAVDMCLKVIRNLIWYIVNQLKSWLMAEVTKYLNLIGLSSSNPIPYFVKITTEVIVQILKTIGCSLDESLVEAIMGGIEGFIETFVSQLANQLVSEAEEYISFAEECINNIFGSIFELVSVATQIADAIEDIISLIEGLTSFGGAPLFDSNGYVNGDMLSSVGNVVSFILNLLGIGCNRTTDSPLQINWNECSPTDNNCSPFNLVVTGGVPGIWNPEYSKIFVQSTEAGHTILMDDTPYNNRFVIEAGGSRTGFEVFDNGDIKVTNSNNKTEVTFGKQQVSIKGDAYINVKGNYHLQVGGDYHLEVRGKYSVSASRESKLTYYGEHETIYKNDSKLSAANGLALAASKIGLSASGQLDLISPTFSTYTTEQNHLCTGSYNRFIMYDNKFTGLNTFKIMGGFRNVFRAGVNFDWGVGSSTKLQAATDIVWKGGLYSKTILGAYNSNKLSIDNENIFGAKNRNNLSVNYSNIIGLDLMSKAGATFGTNQGLFVQISQALGISKNPFTLHS
jgi:hypothetical protein